jgi:hypothetical protein
MFGTRSEVVKTVLFVQFAALLVPVLPVLVATTDAAKNI